MSARKRKVAGAEAKSRSDLRLPAVLTIVEAAAFKPECLAALKGGHDLALDCSAVERVDTAGLQLVAAVVAEAARRSLQVVWAGRSKAWDDAAGGSGLGTSLLEPTGTL